MATAGSPPSLSRTVPAGAAGAALGLALLYARALPLGVAPTASVAQGWVVVPMVLLWPGLAGALARTEVTGRVLAVVCGLAAPFVLGAFESPPVHFAFGLQLAAFVAWRTGRLLLASLLLGVASFFDPRAAVTLVALAIGEYDAHRAGDGTITPARSFAFTLAPGFVLATVAFAVATGPASPFEGWEGVGLAVQREARAALTGLGPSAWRAQLPALWWPWLAAASLAVVAGGLRLLRRSGGHRRESAPRLTVVAAIWTLVLEGALGWGTADRPLPLVAFVLLLGAVEGVALLHAGGRGRFLLARLVAAVLGLGLALGLWGSVLARFEAHG